MILYNEKNKKVEITSKMFDRGHCAEIHKINDQVCAKIYYDDCSFENRIYKSMYEDLKTIKSDYLVKLYQLLYKDLNHEIIRGYIMKYYIDNPLIFLYKEVEFALSMMEEHLKLIDQLSERNIIVEDLSRENIVYSDDKVIIIDPDLFYHNYEDPYEINLCNLLNYRKLFIFYKILFQNEIKKILDVCQGFKISELLFDFNSDRQMVKSLKDNFRGYKYPIDYVLSKK